MLISTLHEVLGSDAAEVLLSLPRGSGRKGLSEGVRRRIKESFLVDASLGRSLVNILVSAETAGDLEVGTTSKLLSESLGELLFQHDYVTVLLLLSLNPDIEVSDLELILKACILAKDSNGERLVSSEQLVQALLGAGGDRGHGDAQVGQ